MINGAPCRLLDIQELLSDTGIGRQQHVIVGQGQLDAVLNARPEDRRAIIEEAAGILKFRKRKEKAERRLEATEGEPAPAQRPAARGAPPAAARSSARPTPRAATTASSPSCARSRLHLAGREIDRLTVREERRVDARGELAALDEQDVRVPAARARRRTWSTSSARSRCPATTTSPICSRASRRCASASRAAGNLVAERRRGIERELAAVADEGVVETLVAEAARTRDELARASTPTPTRSRPRTVKPTGARETRAAQLRAAPTSRRSRGRAPRRCASARAAEGEVADAPARDRRRRARSAETIARDLAQCARRAGAEVDARAARRSSRAGPRRTTSSASAAALRAEVERRRPRSRPSSRAEARARRAAEDARAARRRRVARAPRPRRRAGGPAPRRSRSRSTTRTRPRGDSVELDGVIGPLARPPRDRRRRRDRGGRRARRRAARDRASTATPRPVPRSTV